MQKKTVITSIAFRNPPTLSRQSPRSHTGPLLGPRWAEFCHDNPTSGCDGASAVTMAGESYEIQPFRHSNYSYLTFYCPYFEAQTDTVVRTF